MQAGDAHCQRGALYDDGNNGTSGTYTLSQQLRAELLSGTAPELGETDLERAG